MNYNPVAKHASVLFFTVVEIGNIDPMYQYSLTYFIQLFLRSIKDSPKQKAIPGSSPGFPMLCDSLAIQPSDPRGPTPAQGWDVSQRLQALSDHFTYFLFTNVCRSLFEKDKVLFAFKLAVNLRMAEGKVDAGELRFLLTGGVAVGDNPHENPAAEWLSAKSWTEIWLLDMLPAFQVRTGASAWSVAWSCPFVGLFWHLTTCHCPSPGHPRKLHRAAECLEDNS